MDSFLWCSSFVLCVVSGGSSLVLDVVGRFLSIVLDVVGLADTLTIFTFGNVNLGLTMRFTLRLTLDVDVEFCATDWFLVTRERFVLA